MAIGLNEIDRLTGDKLGTFDVPCSECGPIHRSPRGQRKAVLRIWRIEPGFATYCCARCGAQGYARDRAGAPPDPAKLAKARATAAEHERTVRAEQLRKALWLWSVRQPIIGSIAERYLRRVRGYCGPLPATLGLLPPRGLHPPAMIAAFGVAYEVDPGVLAIADHAVTGVHLTRLKPDGSGKADEDAKIMLGHSTGSPIVLAPPNDLLGLVVTEGIENGLSVYEGSGWGVWAAGSASRMPALAAAVPRYIDCVTVVADNDPDGRRHATELARRLRARKDLIADVRVIVAGAARGRAA
jgi:hypothetical protein